MEWHFGGESARRIQLSFLPATANDLPNDLNPAGNSPALAPVWSGIVPGLVLVAMITTVAYSMRNLSGLTLFSPMILAVVAGMVYSNVLGLPAHAKAGIAFSQKRLLRFAIVLLGFQLTLGQVAGIGLGGVGIVAATLGATFLFTVTLGRLLGVDAKLARLIAAGSSICGASAIVATNIVTEAHDEDVTYAVAAITLFGTIAMLGFPLLAPVFGLDQHAFGLWAGASIHEVAQVIGAGFQNGTQAGETATVAKLTRVAMLAPMVIALGLMARRGSTEASSAKPPMPWFVVAFVAVVALNSLVAVPTQVHSAIALAAQVMLTMGLAAMGLQADISQLRSRGLRPLMLAFSAFIFIAGFSLTLVKFA
ncbi:YeiH family putative sulfate export transporter [Mesorhizobium hawassense]|uniref:YeiH family putative sulfate export transporter n=1 Tax=Mesorhizobium hawassense TaxID=1209954 RepID=A0A330HLX6_9HYPH|nr:YeiH family putative sulfate export transporter [Mesorhizobium hawassense]